VDSRKEKERKEGKGSPFPSLLCIHFRKKSGPTVSLRDMEKKHQKKDLIRREEKGEGACFSAVGRGLIPHREREEATRADQVGEEEKKGGRRVGMYLPRRERMPAYWRRGRTRREKGK